jgi:hypothetical protein
MEQDQSPLWRQLEGLPPTALGVHRYLLINQAAFSQDLAVIQGLNSFDRHPLLGSNASACSDGATPFLLLFDGTLGNASRTRTIRKLCTDGCFANAISVIDSRLAVPALLAALRARSNAVTSDGQHMLLRYFDTRVMEPLVDAMTPEQRVQWVSCSTSWWFCNRWGELEPLVCEPWPGVDSFTPPFRTTAKQEAHLLSASEADAIVDLLARNQVQGLIDLPYPHRQPTVKRLLAAAQALKLTGTPEQAAYCSLALEAGEDFGSMAPWNQLLPKVERGEITFVQAIEWAAEHQP